MKKKSNPGIRRKVAKPKHNLESLPRSVSRESQMMQRLAGGFRGASLSNSDIEQALLFGKNTEVIEQLVGKDYAEKLRQLASEANQTRVAGAPRVLILPGILGSTLAVGNDTIWLDVLDIMRGRLRELSLDGGVANVESNGAFWPTYLELKFKLRRQGYQAEYFHYDWRKPIAEAGMRLTQYVRSMADETRPISLVAHSMGGLVARSALKSLGDDAEKLLNRTILLGTPNFGSYAPALVLANDYSTVSWMDRLDFVSDKNSLVKDVFSTFIGLMEMIPEPNSNDGVDLFRSESYPSQSNFGRVSVLKAAAGLQTKLSAGNDRIWMIAGTGIETVVGLERKDDDPKRFTQRLSLEGDGTVPLRLAMLPNAKHRFCRVAHSSLPSNNEVVRATIEILASGTTKLLSSSPGDVSRSVAQRKYRSDDKSEAELQEESDSLPRLAQALAPCLSLGGDSETEATPQLAAAPPKTDEFAPSAMSKKPIVVGRKYQNRLDLTLMLGDVSLARGRAIMLGVFKDVRPGGAAAAIDARLGGVLAEVIERRMFSANVGEVFVIPAPRHNIGAEMVALIGLGSFSMFTAKSLRSSVENATRTLLRCNVDDLITVPMGGGTGMPIRVVSEAILDGVQAAMKDSRDRISLRGLTLATISNTDFEQMSKTVLDLATSSRFDGMEFTIDQKILEISERSSDRSAPVIAPRHLSSYLIVREVPTSVGQSDPMRHLDISLLGASSKAAVISDQVSVDDSKLEKLLLQISKEQEAGIRKPKEFINNLRVRGNELSECVLPPLVREALSGAKPESLTVINDFWSSKIPWEILSIDEWQASSSGNVSRRYSTSNMSVAKWLHERRSSEVCRMLLVVDPTEDLFGAKNEGDDIGKIIKRAVLEIGTIDITEVRGAEATRDRLVKEFSSGKYDIVHFAGHADFNEKSRSQSGILCSQGIMLTGRELSLLENLPTLMVFNACESGRVRSISNRGRTTVASTNRRTTIPLSEVVDRSVSFAEAFLRGGVGSFVGTYWPVSDSGAALFAKEFYSKLVATPGVSIGDALRVARLALLEKNEPDYANYIHYGDPEFRVKV